MDEEPSQTQLLLFGITPDLWAQRFAHGSCGFGRATRQFAQTDQAEDCRSSAKAWRRKGKILTKSFAN